MKKIILYSFALVCLCLYSCVSARYGQGADMRQLYEKAVADASRPLTEKDIYSRLIPLRYGASPLIEWKICGTDTLLLAGSLQKTDWLSGVVTDSLFTSSSDMSEAIWVFIPRELDKVLMRKNLADSAAVSLRMFQLLGLPPGSEFNTVYLFWVNRQDLLRPSYNPDAGTSYASVAYPQNVDPEYKQWFENFVSQSYGNPKLEDNFPFTRLGYTYDWYPDSSPYGVSEFIVRPDSRLRLVRKESEWQYYRKLKDKASE